MNRLDKTINYLKKKKRILLITTSSRWIGDKELPKSSLLAKMIKEKYPEKTKVINAAKLRIYNCEGNVSGKKGNNCGLPSAALKNKHKNPSGNHRCWASINNKDDELWRISKELFDSDTIIFFGSVRWGQMNAIYQKIIERLTWIENRASTLDDENIVKGIDAGLIAIGQNWNGKNVVKLQKQVLSYFGFNTPKELFWNWQYTKDEDDESQESYKSAFQKFKNTFLEKKK